MKLRVMLRSFLKKDGYTLLEVLVSLVLGCLILGGLMGMISLSLHYSHRLKEKSQIQPLLESAAQEILANPQKAAAPSVTIGSGSDAPRVNIRLARVQLPEFSGPFATKGALYRVLLECRGQVLEFSLYVLPSDMGETGSFPG